ncbi:MAG: hypothetical protein Q9216_004339 [Gyalolechia sp. 2 TL-2023]
MDQWWGQAVVIGVVVVALSLMIHRLQDAQPPFDEGRFTTSHRSAVSATLIQALPNRVFFGPHPVFVESIQSYWAIQERDIIPQCIVRPRSAKEVAVAVAILKRDFDARVHRGDRPPLFAVRSGGHSPIPAAANVNGGVVIDLRLLNDVKPSEDGSSVVIGTGAKWFDVSKALDERGLAVAGGRNSAVGVGGLTLGGGLSFFSPRVGFVCNNIISYEIILANGTLITASETINPGLWRALKGGSNNFGIVTSFVARSFPSANIWSGFLYMTASKANQLIRTFHEFTQAKPDAYDEYAAGPLVCFTYLQQLGIQVLATNLVYTKPEQWPGCFSGFKSIGRLWSTVKIRSLTSATNELEMSSPPGLRQLFVTTTVKNDHTTLVETHAAYKKGMEAMRRVSGMVWTLVLQPLLPAMAKKGQADSQGLDTRTESLVIVLFTVVWKNSADDELVDRTTRSIIDGIDRYAESKGTADPYRYLNDCASWQNPFDGYGAENKRFLQEMSRTYDPDGLFQRACVGGFKLDMDKVKA